MVQSMLRLANRCQFRIINVAIKAKYADSMEYLADAMDLMLNLHTIQIMCHGFRGRRCGPKEVETKQFLKAFGCHDYPSVRRAILPIQARGMLASLPAVVDVCGSLSPICHSPSRVLPS